MSWLHSTFEKCIERTKRHAKWIPWFSLGAGIVGALLMERSPKTSVIVFAAAFLGWLAIFALGWVGTMDSGQAKTKRAAQLFVTWLTQNLMQQCLFFVVPFYLMSSSLIWGHLLFCGILILVCLLSLWDPCFEAMVRSTERRVVLQSFVIFVTIHAIGPFVGLRNLHSLYLAALASACGAPIVVLSYAVDKKQKMYRALGAFAGTALLFLAFARLGAPSILPPAPLKLVTGGMGSGYSARSLVGASEHFPSLPRSLVCASAIKAPTTATETLVHVWTINGVLTDKISLGIKGGREEGFRTYSRKSRLKPGRAECRVETQSGQRIATFAATLGPATPKAVVAKNTKR